MSDTKKLSERFDNAANLLARGQCKGKFATSQDGGAVSARSSYAVCWCSMGAMHASGTWDYDTYKQANGLPNISRIGELHDSSSAEQNIARMRQAAEYCRGQGR